MKRLLFALGYLNALPVTLAGLLLAVCGAAAPFCWHQGVLVCVAQPGGLWEWFFAKGPSASTWGGVMILARPGLLSDAKLVTHELRHFWQARVLGVLLGLAYLLGAAWAVIRGGHWYRDNFVEIDARSVEGAA